MSASIVGSLHCAGMCGAFVLFACGAGSGELADQGGTHKAAFLRSPHVLNMTYNLGRLISYALLGAIFGYLGQVVDLTGSTFHIQRLAIFIAGGMMILFGLIAVIRLSGVRIKHLSTPAFVTKFATAAQRASMTFHPFNRALMIGLTAILLPCGWLYLFALYAAGTASPIYGMVVMAAFWLGTVPYLAAIGLGAQQLRRFLGSKASLITACLIILLGCSMVGRGFVIDTAAFAEMGATTGEKPKAAGLNNVIDQIKETDSSDLPCCFDGSE